MNGTKRGINYDDLKTAITSRQALSRGGSLGGRNTFARVSLNRLLAGNGPRQSSGLRSPLFTTPILSGVAGREDVLARGGLGRVERSIVAFRGSSPHGVLVSLFFALFARGASLPLYRWGGWKEEMLDDRSEKGERTGWKRGPMPFMPRVVWVRGEKRLVPHLDRETNYFRVEKRVAETAEET